MTKLPKNCCVFCGGRADSLEHIIAQRLFKRAGQRNFKIIVGKTVDEKVIVNRKLHTLENLTVRCVCRECNQGWMNQLECWFEKRLGFLIEPTWPHLADTMIETLKTEKDDLVRWMMKTAVVVNENSVVEKIFPSSLTLKLSSGYIPPDLFVDVAYSRMSTVAFTFNQAFQVINGGRPPALQLNKPGRSFRFTAQLNHLLLRLSRVPDARVTYWSFGGERPIAIYPEPVRKNPPFYEYQSLAEFDRSIVLETSLAHQKRSSGTSEATDQV